jgi:hypothetical protein
VGRHALRRGGLAAAVSSLAVAVAAASAVVVLLPEGGGTAQAAPAAGTAEITLADPSSATARTDRPFVAGTSGYLHRQSGVPGLLWTDYASGTSVTVENADGVYTPGSGCTSLGSECRTAWYGSESDLVALPSSLSSPTVTLWDPATRNTRTMTSASSYDNFRALAGDTVLTGNTLIDFVDGKQRERTITGEFAGFQDKDVVAADAKGVLISRYAGGDMTYVDVETAVNTPVFDNSGYADHFLMSDDRIGWFDSGTGEVRLKSRGDLAAPAQVFDLPSQGVPDGDAVLIGDWLVMPLYTGRATSALTAVSLTDGSTRTLLHSADPYLAPGPGDTALVTGGTSAGDWWTQRLSLAEDGTPTLEKLHRVPAPENPKAGLALGRGSLRVVERTASGALTTSVRTLTTNGGTTLSASAATDSVTISPKCPYPGTVCAPLWANHDGTEPLDVYLDTFDDSDEGGSGLGNADQLISIGYNPLRFDTAGGTIVDVSDEYAVYNSGGSSPAQYVGEFGYGQLLKRSVRAAALNGSTLWSATSTPGTLTPYSLTAKKTLTSVTVPGLGCVPSELQAAGRWVYWACGTSSAGVYDTKAGVSRAVTPGDVLLGDGFTVRHDHAGQRLVLTEAATGATRVLASEVPDTGLAADRRIRWTLDEYTGLVAWFDVYEQTHVATTGIAPSPVTVFRAEAPDYAQPSTSYPWTAHWQLSRPATSWSLTFTSVQSGPKGRATRTLTGGPTTSYVSAQWTGRTSSGDPFPNGHFTWTLKATGLGASTASTAATGKGFLQRGAPVRRDFTSADGPDGRGDLVTLNSSGGVTYHSGTGTGKFGEKVSAGGWPTSARVVPFGDLSGDRYNDVLVRFSSGTVRLFKPGRNAPLKPSTAYTTIATGSGWNQYDVLTSPGDVTRDGRPDLIARNSSTGAVYLYKGTSTGKLSSRVKLYDDWKTYKKIVGAGDLNGDGIGDLVAQDRSNVLYRYFGKGDGTFASRVKLFTDWGASYNAVVGVGDITDDGKADLVARDSGGNLYRNSGDGKGSFGGRVKIATGWRGYKSVS